MQADLERLIDHLPALVAVAFVAYGVAAIWTTDSLLEGWRSRLEDWAYLVIQDRDGNIDTSYRGWEDGTWRQLPAFARGKLVDLLTCPKCSGWWVIFFAWWALTGENPVEGGVVWWAEAFAARGAHLVIVNVADREGS